MSLIILQIVFAILFYLHTDHSMHDITNSSRLVIISNVWTLCKLEGEVNSLEPPSHDTWEIYKRFGTNILCQPEIAISCPY